MSSAICFNLDQSKILSSGNGLSAETQSQKYCQSQPVNQGICLWREGSQKGRKERKKEGKVIKNVKRRERESNKYYLK